MSKAIRVTAIVSVIIKVIFIIAGILADIVSSSTAASSARNIDISGSFVAIFLFLILEFFDLVVKIIMMVILLFVSKSEGDNYLCELLIMIVCSIGILGLIGSGLSVAVTYVISSGYGYEMLSTFSSARVGSSYVSFINTISCSLMLISASIAFCKKKWVNGLLTLINGEVDI